MLSASASPISHLSFFTSSAALTVAQAVALDAYVSTIFAVQFVSSCVTCRHAVTISLVGNNETKENHMSTSSKTPVAVIKQVITSTSDEELVTLAKASLVAESRGRTNFLGNLNVVQWSIIEVLCERHPHIIEALDEWELDLDGDRSQIQVVIDCMEVK